MIALASRALFRLATTLVVLLAVVVAGAGTAHAQQVDDSLPPLADLTIASEYVDIDPLAWLLTVKNETVGAHPGMHISLVKVRFTMTDPVRGDTTGIWTIRDLPPGGSAVGPPHSIATGVHALFHWPPVTDGPEWVPQRLYAEIIESNPVESPRFRFNNATEHWVVENRHEGEIYATNGDVGIDVPSISDRFPPPGGATTFTVAAIGRDLNVSDRRYDPLATGQDHRLFDVQVEISLSPGLSFAANQPEAPSAFDATTFDASTGIWNIGSIRSHNLSLPVAVNLTADSLSDLLLEERCLTAKLVSAVPWFANDPLKRQNDTATACLGKTPFSSGAMDLIDYYPCIGVTDYPCTSADTLELFAARSVGGRSYFRQPESVIVHVPDPDGRTSKGGSVIWSTDDLMGLEINWTKLAPGWSVGVSGEVTAPGGGDAPGRWLLTNPDDSTDGNLDLLDAMDSSTVEWHLTDLGLQNLGAIWSDPAEYLLGVKVDFWALGTYEALLGISGSVSETTYTDSGTYIFHVGPIAELEARDGGPTQHDLENGQTAFTIVAVNNGPDDPVGAKVDVTLPQGATVVRAIPSAGSYNGGVWDIGGELRHKDYYRLSGGRLEGEELTLILDCPTGGCGEATARIYNDNDNHPYTVTIDGSQHTGPVYDHIPENNTTTLTARPGTGGGGPDAPAAGSPPRSEPAAIVLEWQPVATVNGWEVSHYALERSSSSWQPLADDVECPAPDEPSYDHICQFVDLDAQAGQSYRYRVRAVNSQDVPGPWSRPMEMARILTVGVPDAPALTATPNEPRGDMQILLTWNKPVENGSAIISYTIEVAERSNGPWAAPTDPAPALGPDATEWTHADLPDGTTRYYRLLATNAQGDSPWSNVVEAKTRAGDIPGAPENVRAAADGGNAIDVSWDPPRNDGGTPVTRYEVQWSADGVSGWRGAGSTADGETLTFKHTGLAFGKTRHYRVAARNSRGLSQWSYPPHATATTLAGAPGVPSLTARAEAHNIINLKWTKPADNGSSITKYDIQWSEDGKPGGWRGLTSVSPAEVTGYADGGLGPVTTRYYRVRAVNGAGAGTWSRAASATTLVKKEVGVGRPTAPLNLTVLPGDGSIGAVWDPPASDGGAEIKGYSVQFRGSGSWEKVEHDGAHTDTFIFEHSNGALLTNGRRYYVRVAAINESGYTGPWAQASAVPNIPRHTPGEPRNVVPTGGHGHIVVTWREPYGLGHPELSGYRVQYREDCTDNCGDWLPATPISASATDRSATITVLDNGTTYQVMVWAVNRAGDSPKAGADGALKATPQQAGDGQGHPPTNPRNLRLSPGAGQITATWSAPVDQGNPAFAGYQVQYRCRWCSYDEWGDWTTLTFGEEESTTATRTIITGLDPEIDWQVQVKTVDNGYGSGLAIAQTRTR